MKRLTKLTKIFLVITIIFSQLSGVVTVFAEELSSKTLDLRLEKETNLDTGNIEKYILYYDSIKDDYEEYADETEKEKTYDIVLTTTFTYIDGSIDTIINKCSDVTGKMINDGNSCEITNAKFNNFNGTFTVNVAVQDGESVIYTQDTNEIYHNENNYSGLIGYVNGTEVKKDEEGNNKIIVTTPDEYNVTYKLMIGDLNPNSYYRILNSDGTYSETMTALELGDLVLDGETIDLENSFYGTYNTEKEITIEEVDNESVINTYNYTYSMDIVYAGDNAEVLNNLFDEINLSFTNDTYAAVYVPEISGLSVPTVGMIIETITSSDEMITVLVTDSDGNEITNLNEEIKNGYVITLTKGIDITYSVIVIGDSKEDNHLTREDMLDAMKAHLTDEKIFSMDVFNVDLSTENEGKIEFEDIMYFNEFLKDQNDDNVIPNQNLSFELIKNQEKVFVGDEFNIDVVINTNNVNDYIDGIRASLQNTDNLELVNIKFNDKFIGTYNEDGMIVAAGENINGNESIVMTLTFRAIKEGNATIAFEGMYAKYLDFTDIDTLEENFGITRKVSNNNNLSSLNASVGTFDKDFDKDVTVYTLTVPADTEKVILSGALEDILSNAQGLIEYELKEDKTTVNITVTSEDGSTKVYTIYIIKEQKSVTPIVYYYSDNNYLKLLEIDGYKIDFDKNVFDYELTVKNIKSLDITAIAEDSRSRVEITGNENFKNGKNTVIITVKAENGSTREYKILVNKVADEKDAVVDTNDSSNTAEKVVIIILIILVVLGLLYLIFKKDEEEVLEVKPEKEKERDSSKKNTNKKK